MKRYLNSFLLTTLIYMAVVLIYIFNFNEIKKPVLKNENIIVMNHISLIEQKEVIKKVVKPKKKNKPKKKVKKKVEQKLTKVKKFKKSVKNLVTKKEVVKPIETIKEEITEIEEVQPKIVKTVIQRTYKQSFEDEYLKKIVRLIQENIKYPKRAKVMNVQGRVVIEFLLTIDGKVSDFKVISGHKFLNKATIKAIKLASISFPKVKESVKLKVPIIYSLI